MYICNTLHLYICTRTSTGRQYNIVHNYYMKHMMMLHPVYKHVRSSQMSLWKMANVPTQKPAVHLGLVQCLYWEHDQHTIYS